MKRLLLLAGFAAALAGCNVDPNVATPNQEIIAINAYNAAVSTATVYLKQPLCSTTVTFPCRTQALSQSVYTALKSGRAARKTLLANLSAGTPASLTALQALEAAYSVIQQIPAS